MIDYEEALRLVLEHARPRGTERVATAAARGRILAEDVVAHASSPPFNKAAMDGYAVRADDVQELPAELEIVGEVLAGQFPDFTVGPGQAAGITTGAPVPAGADTVIMVEHTERVSNSAVRVMRLSGANICAKGEDIRSGDAVLSAGQVLTPLRVGVAATAGHAMLTVHRRPSAALLCTGNEVIEPGLAPQRGEIFDANGPMLSSLMEPLCRDFAYLGIVGDDEEELEAKMRQGLASEVLVISGGVSVGRYDLVPAVLGRAGVERIFHKVAIKPGKPTFFGATATSIVFGMPGNPQSCFVVFHMLVAPAMAAMSGATELPPVLEEGVAAQGFKNKPERMNVMPCAIEQRDGVNLVRRCPYHGSADIVGPSAADGYFIVPRGTERVQEGDTLRFFRT